MRGFGEIEAAQAIVPEWAVPLFVVVTALGSSGTFAVLCTLLYWYGDRRRGAFVLGAVLVGLALTFSLKALFGAPRPPVAGQLVVTQTAAFPSGHALGSTVTYGILASTLREFGTARRRYLIAALLVTSISLSRIVLGVHYLADVVAGVGFGLIVLVTVRRLGTPRRVLWLASAIAVTGTVGSAAFARTIRTCVGSICLDPYVAILSGAAVGAVIAYEAIDVPDDPMPLDGTGIAVGVVAAALLGGLVVLGWVLPIPLPFAVAGTAVAAAGFVTFPAIKTRLGRARKSESVD